MGVETVRVAIFDNSQAPYCGLFCGIDWGSPRAAGLIMEQLREEFEAEVKVECLDLAEEEVRRRFPEVAQRVFSQSLPLPLITINGVPKLWGNVDYGSIIEAIKAQREVSHG